MTEKLLNRIKKIRALTNSPNEEEAALAAGMAAELMAKHNISEAQIADLDKEEEIEELVIAKQKRKTNWKGNLASGLAKAFNCRCYWQNIYSGRKQIQTQLTLVGRPSDTATVSYLHQTLVKEIERLAKKRWGEIQGASDAHGKAWKQSYRLGVVSGVTFKAMEARKAAMASAKEDPAMGQALIRINQHQNDLDLYLKEIGVVKGKPILSGYAGAYHLGNIDGKGLDIGDNKPTLGEPVKQLR